MSPRIPRASATAALDAIERAWGALVDVVGVPPPESRAGGAWVAYLVDRGPLHGGQAAGSMASTAWLAGRDPRSRYDRGQSFGVIDADATPGCALDRAAARAVARGSLYRAAPATDEPSAIAQSEMLARLAAPCAEDDDDDAAFQRSPEDAVAESRADASGAFERGAAMFYDWLDARFSAEPGAVTVGTWALAPTVTPASAWNAGRWAASPSLFDVLRISLASALWTGSTMDDVFGAFAVARATPPRIPPSPEVAWRIAWPATARRLASPRPVAPTGSSYVVVDHAGAPTGARLRLEAQWEDYARMRWTAVKARADGEVIAAIPIAAPDLATHASITIEGLDDVDHVTVVGANVGSTEHPFHSNQGEWEAHGWMLTVEGE